MKNSVSDIMIRSFILKCFCLFYNSSLSNFLERLLDGISIGLIRNKTRCLLISKLSFDFDFLIIFILKDTNASEITAYECLSKSA